MHEFSPEPFATVGQRFEFCVGHGSQFRQNGPFSCGDGVKGCVFKNGPRGSGNTVFPVVSDQHQIPDGSGGRIFRIHTEGMIAALAVNGEVNLGDVTLQEKNTDNYFLNGDFSNGLTGWMTNDDSSYISVQDSVLNVSDKVPTGDVKLYQAMYLEKGIYRLSFDVLGAPTSWRPVYFMGTALDNSSVTGAQLRVSDENGKVVFDTGKNLKAAKNMEKEAAEK